MTAKRDTKRLFRMSRIAPKREVDEIDSVSYSKRECDNRRSFGILMEAQHYWNQMEYFRKE